MNKSGNSSHDFSDRWIKRFIKSFLDFPPVTKFVRLPGIRTLYALLFQIFAPYYLMNANRAHNAVHQVSPEWRARIDDVIACPDNVAINRVGDAGLLKNNCMTMHNGVRVYAMSYYGGAILNMLIENRGVHEPQEERAFTELLDYLPEKSTMLELGSYWAFYSLTLLAKLKDATCYMIEPNDLNIIAGKENFKLNGKKGHFEQAYVGETDKSPLTDIRTISVDGFCARHGIEHLDVLHADIQGNELKMLRGAQGMLSRGCVDYILISTHSNELHHGCEEVMRSYDYQILASADLDDTYSVDGLIVAKRGRLEGGPSTLQIAHKRTSD